MTTIQEIQTLLGVAADDIWGPVTQEALRRLIVGEKDHHHVVASSFADPADIRAFKKCKATGKTDQQCFKVGDNGIGNGGTIPPQTSLWLPCLRRTGSR
jgi:hypothetical protein